MDLRARPEGAGLPLLFITRHRGGDEGLRSVPSTAGRPDRLGEEIERVTRNYGTLYAPVPEEGGDYAMDHSGFIVLMGPAGEYLTYFESDVRLDELVAELERRIAP
jgi:cytochrome oxidase Cu insertion factor (SCO1/SenC/PrrC family)